MKNKNKKQRDSTESKMGIKKKEMKKRQREGKKESEKEERRGGEAEEGANLTCWCMA